MPPLREAQLTLPRFPSQLGYLAGVFDGEGHVSRTGRARGQAPVPGRWVVGITNSNRALIDWLARIGGTVQAKARGAHQQPAWTWLVLARRDQLQLLVALHPLLIVKRTKVAQVLAELEARESNAA